MTEERRCPECGDKITGRKDKKFCSDYCRSLYNNKRKDYNNETTRRIDRVLKKNRRILQELNRNGKTKVHISRLNEKGFVFDYFTNIYKTKAGTVYHFCYEEGYLRHNEEFFTLVRWEQNQ